MEKGSSRGLPFFVLCLFEKFERLMEKRQQFWEVP